MLSLVMTMWWAVRHSRGSISCEVGKAACHAVAWLMMAWRTNRKQRSGRHVITRQQICLGRIRITDAVRQIVQAIQIVEVTGAGQVIGEMVWRPGRVRRIQASGRTRPDLVPVRVGVIVQIEAGAESGQRLASSGRRAARTLWKWPKFRSKIALPN